MKICSGCSKEKKDSEFYKDKSRPSGLTYRCKVCIKEARGDKYKCASSPRNLSAKARENESIRKKKYKKDHPDVVAASNRKTYVMRKELSIECTNAEVKQFMAENLYCVQCGSTEDLTLDHIIPVSWGILSRHALDNFQTLCNSCNGTKKANSSIDFRPFEESTVILFI